MEDLLTFRRFTIGDEGECVESCCKGAVDKLQTLYPGKRITVMTASRWAWRLTASIRTRELMCTNWGLSMGNCLQCDVCVLTRW